MNHLNRSVSSHEGIGEAERTLHVIAHLPAPEGLEERVKAGLRAAPRSARVLDWPAIRESGSSWMHGKAARAAAAAAIVFVVAGGGWGVYSRVQPPAQSKVIVMPQRVNGSGGFSSAGAMRTPQTLNGPVLAHSATTMPKQDGSPMKVSPTVQKLTHAKGAHKVKPLTQATTAH
jgi:hypothetical protein